MAQLARVQGARFDRLFLQLMIRHHRGGIEMAADARKHAALAVVREAAATMLVEQVEDIATMRSLLSASAQH